MRMPGDGLLEFPLQNLQNIGQRFTRQLIHHEWSCLPVSRLYTRQHPVPTLCLSLGSLCSGLFTDGPRAVMRPGYPLALHRG